MKYHCHSDHIRIRDIEQADEKVDFVHEYIATLMQNAQKHRVLSVTGEPGVGKSTILRHTLWHLKHRRLFTGGIMMINLKPINSG